MRAVFHVPWETADRWFDALAAALPEVRFDRWADTTHTGHDIAVVWKAPAALFADRPGLRLVCSLGAGTDHILAHGSLLAPGVRVLRLVDPLMGERMAEYVLAGVLRHTQNHDLYAGQQAARQWRRHAPRDARAVTVGILGLGHLGTCVARTLLAVGFTVAAWTRRPRPADAIACHHGPDGLAQVLAAADILVCLLPATAETRGMIDAAVLAGLKPGALFINAARGELVDEAALLAALDSGRLSAAMLDAFPEEPLPAASPLWAHPRVIVTPHVASLSDPDSGAAALAADIRRCLSGGVPLGEIDRTAGY